MVGTIVPAGRRELANTAGALMPAVSHVLGLVLSATVTGGVLVLIGALSSPSRTLTVMYGGALIAACVAVWLREGSFISLPMPQRREQVPHGWRARRAFPFLYGLGLGAGLYVHIRFATYYLLIGWVALAPVTPVIKVGVFAGYGLGRGIPVLSASLRRTALTPDRSARTSRLVNVVHAGNGLIAITLIPVVVAQFFLFV